MTRQLTFLFAALSAVPVAVLGQGPAAAPTKTLAAAPGNPISARQNKMYTMLSGVIVAAAEKMPEDNYSLKPTSVERRDRRRTPHDRAERDINNCTAARRRRQHSNGRRRSHARELGLLRPNPDLVWRSWLTYEQLNSEHWLAAYEIGVKSWVVPENGADYIKDHKFFSLLRRHTVSFYDVTQRSGLSEGEDAPIVVTLG